MPPVRDGCGGEWNAIMSPESGMGAAAPSNGASAYDTVPKLLIRNAKQFGERDAMRFKDLGIWQSFTWGQTRDEIRALALGLRKLGIERGDVVAIVGDNRPRLYWAFTAVQSLGGIPVPMYQDSVADEMAYVLDHAGVKMAVVQNQEQVDKLLSVSDRVPSLQRIVYDDPRGLRDYDHSRLHEYAEVQKLGRDEMAANPGALAWWHEQIEIGKGADVSVMLYTSGTTGRPKGVMLSHDNVVKSGQNANLFDRFTPDDTMLAYLPMAWVGDHIFSYGQAYAGGLCVACPESAETIVEDRREIGPTYFFAPPRVFESMLTEMTVRMEDASRFKKGRYDYFMKVALRAGENVLNCNSVGIFDRFPYWFGDKLVYAPLRNRMGFSNLRLAYTAGEAIGPELFRFYRSIGINLKQLYGQTETCAYVCLQPDGQIRFDSVGKPAPGVEVKIADNGEILVKGPMLLKEYYKRPDATAEAIDADGYFMTGDAGLFDDDGHLKIIDRAKDVGKLANGAMYAPNYIENKLKFFQYIKEAVVFGDRREMVCAFINIDIGAVGNWAERRGIAYSGYTDLAAKPEVYGLIQDCIEQVNGELVGEGALADSQIHRFLILHKELDPDDDELTRTRKVRRAFVAEKYAPLIDALYGGRSSQFIETAVKFEDGRQGKVAADLVIGDPKTFAIARRAA